ncbi:TRAP transporter substrate-binding protein [Arenicella xantha]|uniref:Tripartite ATP-independent transporter DctP family solute receptor n=1 Tax=Arenicella xantha TaxID=644221 RepID=A0A395JMX9_9GAMM|nr:TRAP transporter substrate-binding protein [Arenicella xantha]RBP53011.1 tripartite ATP-independent transporter DctP family solute receptor [Arenicella xantha]
MGIPLKWGRRLLIVALTLLVTSCSGKDDTVVLKLGHALDTGASVHKGMVYMAERLALYSNGKMKIEIYPSGQLGSERQLVELLQIGSLAMTKVSSSPLESFVPEMKVFSLPYVFENQAHFKRVLDSEVGKALLLSPEKVRLRGMGYYDAGSRSFYTTDRPVRSPADLKGLKIRVQKSQTSVDMIAAMGGAATPISWGELYTALQQGVVDGAENNPPSLYDSRQYEVSKFYSLDEHTFVPDILLMSLHIWNNLDAQQQEWLQKAADDSVKFQGELWQQASDDALKAIEASGVEIIRPDKKPFMDAVVDMKAAYRGTPVGDTLEAIKDL